ncbi:DUF6802 family protein [Gordonia sp. VNQ95]|uniref:DUF6802 family protein n=1 Tax=Gordonia sp. VNQ95 TaxID=3156619 RepID=UPI0032B48F13
MDPFVPGEGEQSEIGAERIDPLVAGDAHGDGALDGVDPVAHSAGVGGAIPGLDDLGTPADDHLWMYDDGRIWDLGPADVDTDDDGVKDSLTRTGPDGLTVYTDRDNDGRVDTVTRIGSDGSYQAHTLDDSGNWVPTDVGRLE